MQQINSFLLDRIDFHRIINSSSYSPTLLWNQFETLIYKDRIKKVSNQFSQIFFFLSTLLFLVWNIFQPSKLRITNLILIFFSSYWITLFAISILFKVLTEGKSWTNRFSHFLAQMFSTHLFTNVDSVQGEIFKKEKPFFLLLFSLS